jgi:hypothetical protein
VTDHDPDIMAESADNVAYGAAMQAVVAAARAWRAAVSWGDRCTMERKLIVAIAALDTLEARLRERAPP